MKMFKALINSVMIGSSVLGTTILGLSGSVRAETLVTCGPNGAAYIVKVVPAGCRHLAATSAPKHSPDNAVEESRLGFTFRASSPTPKSTEPVAVNHQQDESTTNIPVALW
ncbi:MAG: hypothetical protein ACFCU8_04670 [Thermosynechococcaceae cyanobacterium]